MKLLFNLLAVILFFLNNGVSASELMNGKEGESVILDPGQTKTPDAVMTWYFNEIPIAEISGDQSKICTDDRCKERFRDRLKLDHQTGSLTIMNIRTTDSGEYKVEINSRSRSSNAMKNFKLDTRHPSSGRQPSGHVTLAPGHIGGIVVAAVVLVALVVAVIYFRHNISILMQQDEDTL